MRDRLLLTASKVPAGSYLVDVGTDHAHLPIYLAKKGLITGALATDINPGPLERARLNIENHGLAHLIETRQMDGIDRLPPGCALVLAGMGGILISGILAAAPIRPDVSLILQPMTAAYELRTYLYGAGFEITDEALAKEGNRLYVVICARLTGVRHDCGAYLPHIGEKLVEKRDPLLPLLLDSLINKHRRILRGLADARGTAHEQKRAFSCGMLDFLCAPDNDLRN